MNHIPSSWTTEVSIPAQDASVFASGSTVEESKARAEYIARASTSHDALVAAVRAALKYGPFEGTRLGKQLHDVLAAVGESTEPEPQKQHQPTMYGYPPAIDPEYEAMIADVGLHGENAIPEWTKDKAADALA